MIFILIAVGVIAGLLTPTLAHFSLNQRGNLARPIHNFLQSPSDGVAGGDTNEELPQAKLSYKALLILTILATSAFSVLLGHYALWSVYIPLVFIFPIAFITEYLYGLLPNKLCLMAWASVIISFIFFATLVEIAILVIIMIVSYLSLLLLYQAGSLGGGDITFVPPVLAAIFAAHISTADWRALPVAERINEIVQTSIFFWGALSVMLIATLLFVLATKRTRDSLLKVKTRFGPHTVIAATTAIIVSQAI